MSTEDSHDGELDDSGAEESPSPAAHTDAVHSDLRSASPRKRSRGSATDDEDSSPPDDDGDVLTAASPAHSAGSRGSGGTPHADDAEGPEEEADDAQLPTEEPAGPDPAEVGDAFDVPDVLPARPKRQRRRPQRWEGAPTLDARRAPRRSSVASSPYGGAAAGGPPVGGVLQLLQPSAARRGSRGSFGSGGGASGAKGHGAAEESTASVESVETNSPPPEGIDPLDCVESALERARETPGGKLAVVESFHAWQLKTISGESNYQKMLHAYLRRKLRKRSNRIMERERIEEDALRNACSAPGPCMEGDETAASGGVVSDGERESPAGKLKNLDTTIIPDKVRLPLEAYLPRRVRKADVCLSEDDLLERLPQPPGDDGSLRLRTWDEMENDSGDSPAAGDSGTIDSPMGSPGDDGREE